jgi:hypothetical protein
MMTVYADTLIYVMTDVTVISADCAMTGDCTVNARVIVWVACIPTLSPYGQISPCGLMDTYHW